MRRAVYVLMGLMALMVLSACSGGGNHSSGNTPIDNPPGGTPPAAPKLNGYNFSLKEGDYWEFGWRARGSSYAQGSDPSGYDYSGEFRVTLGAPVTIDSISAFPLIISGQPHDRSKQFVHDRWSHIAVAANKIAVSADGLGLKEIFDAQDGTLLGSGFFRPFSASHLYAAVAGRIDNDFIQGDASLLESSLATGQCEYFPEVGQTICGGDFATNYKEREFYQPGIGPVGYYYYQSYSSCGGGFCSGSTDQLDIGLVASSLRGDTVTRSLEQEPNNSPDYANLLSLPATVRGGFYWEEDYGATVTYARINTTDEVEPNNGVTEGRTPQSLLIPGIVAADAAVGDSGESYINTTLTTTPYIEDWYRITPLLSGTYTVGLSFADSPLLADLDLFVMRASDGDLTAMSANDNLNTGIYSEKVTFSAGNVPYYIGVDVFAPAIGRVPYVITVAAVDDAIEFTATDWYEFELNAQFQVAITLAGSHGIVLVDAASNQLLDHGSTNIDTGLLNPGTYRVGVIESGNNYDLSISKQ